MMRDRQQDEPACYCDLCGGEVYLGDRMFLTHRGRICVECAVDTDAEMTWENLVFAGDDWWREDG